MNMLIAIMGDIFGQVNEKQSQSKMEERLNLLLDLKAVLKVFNKKK